MCYSNSCYYFAGNPLCPVSSFKKYLSKLHPSKNDLWQKPRDSFEEDSIWYCNAALGKNTLANMMREIAQENSLILLNQCNMNQPELLQVFERVPQGLSCMAN